MSMKQTPSVSIVGAGLAGPLLAIYLARRGYRVDMYERRSDIRDANIPAGRSINLALSLRGIHALKEVDLWEECRAVAIPMKGRMIHDPEGNTLFQRYGKDDSETINSISRKALNVLLLDKAESYPNVRIHFNQRCTGYDFRTDTLEITDDNSGKTYPVISDIVIGTDGSASAVRTEMQKYGRFNYAQSYLEHGYKELTVPPAPNGWFRMEPSALHIWPRKSFMLIALPNMDKSFTCTLFFPLEGEISFETLSTPDRVWSFFGAQFPDALPMMEGLDNEFFENPTGTLITVRCDPWYAGGKVLLLGDAAHAIVPFFGQGMNCAFEDCSVLNECIDRHDENWESVFEEFFRQRKPNAEAIADLALDNFVEMRDRTADPRFHLKKQIERELQHRHPARFIPKYTMVTFSRMPYKTALERGTIQEEILDSLTESITTIEQVNWKMADTLVLSKLSLPE